MKPKTKFHAHTMRESQVIRSKKSQNLSLGLNFLAAEFCNNSGFVATSGV